MKKLLADLFAKKEKSRHAAAAKKPVRLPRLQVMRPARYRYRLRLHPHDRVRSACASSRRRGSPQTS